MKKIIITCLMLILVAPLTLSFVASYYLRHHLSDNFSTEVELGHIEFNHGWLQSTAQVDVQLVDYGLLIQTINHIHHGPIIWSRLRAGFADAFSLYRIDTRFNIHGKRSPPVDPADPMPGSAITSVSYLGESAPIIKHPGFDLNLSSAQIFTDLPVIDSKIQTDGTIHTLLSGNQFELNDRFKNVYLTSPSAEVKLNPSTAIPSHINAAAASLSVLFGPDRIMAEDVKFSGRTNQTENFSLSVNLNAQSLNLNQAVASQVDIELKIDNVEPALGEYISINWNEISQALEQNHWLVLLKHFSQLLKLTQAHQPDLMLTIKGLNENQVLELNLFGQLLAYDTTQLNPFSLLENIQMKLDAQIPMGFIKALDKPELSNFFSQMTEKGLLIVKDESYYSKLRFENAKIKIAHVLP